MQPPSSPLAAPAGLLPVLAFANFAIGIGAFVVIGILSPIAHGLQLSHAEAGMVMSAYAVAYAIASPLAIAATGGLDRRSVVVIGMVLFIAASMLAALAPTAAALFLARALAAAGAGMVTPVAAAIAVATAAPERRGKALATVFLGLTLAQVAGIPVGSFLGYTAGWRATFWMVAAISALALAGIFRFVPAIRTPVTTLSSLARTLASPALMTAILITASMMSAAYIVFTYFAPLLEDRMGYGRDGVSLVLVVYGGGAVIGNMLGGWLADRIGPVRALILICIGQIIVMPLFSLLPLPHAAVALLAVTWGMVGWAFMVPQQSRLVLLSPGSQNVTLALNASAIYLGAAIGSAAGGAVLDGLGFAALGWVAGLAAGSVLAHVLLSVRLVRESALGVEGAAE
jgi:DHA1 family inner membrane transport protein